MVGGGGWWGRNTNTGEGGRARGELHPRLINLRRTLTGEHEACASVLRAAAYNLNQVRVGLLPLGQQGQQPLTDAGMREVGDDFLNLVAQQRTNAPNTAWRHRRGAGTRHQGHTYGKAP